jgi:hypothetical protein
LALPLSSYLLLYKNAAIAKRTALTSVKKVLRSVIFQITYTTYATQMCCGAYIHNSLTLEHVIISVNRKPNPKQPAYNLYEAISPHNSVALSILSNYLASTDILQYMFSSKLPAAQSSALPINVVRFLLDLRSSQIRIVHPDDAEFPLSDDLQLRSKANRFGQILNMTDTKESLNPAAVELNYALDFVHICYHLLNFLKENKFQVKEFEDFAFRHLNNALSWKDTNKKMPITDSHLNAVKEVVENGAGAGSSLRYKKEALKPDFLYEVLQDEYFIQYQTLAGKMNEDKNKYKLIEIFRHA